MQRLDALWNAFHFAVAPFLVVMASWWLVNRTDRIVQFIFPDLEWEHSLGWLNIRAARRARTALRWIGYFIYLLLACALLGITWSTEGLRESDGVVDASTIGSLLLNMAVLMVCLGFWFVYLGCGLVPSLRRQREREQLAGLRRFRAEMGEKERERDRHTPLASRVKSPLRKPRTNGPGESIVPDGGKRRR
jgi:hypothetical protein